MKGLNKLGRDLRRIVILGLISAGPVLGQTPTATPTAVPAENPFFVLCYHRFVNKADDSVDLAQAEYQMPLEEFKWQMQYLKENGFNPVSLDQLKGYWFQGKPLPLKPVLITFDDGFRTVYRDAYPVIQQYHYPTVFFLYTQFILYGEKALHNQLAGKTKAKKTRKSVEALRDADILAMEKGGMVMESHTTSHLNLGLEEEKRPPVQFARLLKSELSEPLTFVQSRFDHLPTTIAYPYGVYDPQILAATKAAGYELAFTVNAGPNDHTVDPLKLRRNLVLYPISHETFAAIFTDKVLHLEKVSPGDGEVIKSDKPVVAFQVKDEINPKTLDAHLGEHRMTFRYDPKTGLFRHSIGAALKQGGHMITVRATDRQGQKRVYTWYFRIKHRNLDQTK